jgi:hypothetical protein
MRFDRKRWNEEVRELSIKCVDREFVGIIRKQNDGGTLTEEEKQILNIRTIKYADVYTMINISFMIFRIEYALYDNRDLKACKAVCEILDVLNNEDYWIYTYPGDKINFEEAQNLLKLREGLRSCIIE